MAPQLSILFRSPLHALKLQLETPTFDADAFPEFNADAFPEFNADGLPNYDDDTLSILLTEAHRLNRLCDMGKNRQFTNEKEVRKIMYFRNFYDRDRVFFARRLRERWADLDSCPQANARKLNDEVHEFCSRPLAKAFFNYLYNHKRQPGWGPNITDTFELVIRKTEQEVCGRSRCWRAPHDDGQGAVELHHKRPAPDISDEDEDHVDANGKRPYSWQSDATTADQTDSDSQSADGSTDDDETFALPTAPNQPLDKVEDRTEALHSTVKDWCTMEEYIKKTSRLLKKLEVWVEDERAERLSPSDLYPLMLKTEGMINVFRRATYGAAHNADVSRCDWESLADSHLEATRLLSELLIRCRGYWFLAPEDKSLEYLSTICANYERMHNILAWVLGRGVPNIKLSQVVSDLRLSLGGRSLSRVAIVQRECFDQLGCVHTADPPSVMASEAQAALSFIYTHCNSERDEAGYGVYNATELEFLLAEAYRLFSMYEVFKAARPRQLAVEMAELVALRLFVEHYDPEGLFLRFKLANTPFRQSDACLEDGELLLRKGRQFVKGTFKRWSWDHWGGQSLPLDACHAIAREKHLIEHRKGFAMMGLLKASDTTSEVGSPTSVEDVASWKLDVGGSNNSSEGGNGSDSERDKASEGSSTAAAESVASWKPPNAEVGLAWERYKTSEGNETLMTGRVGSWKLYNSDFDSIRRRDMTSMDDAIIERLDTLNTTASAIQREVLYIPKVNAEHVVRNIGYFHPYQTPHFSWNGNCMEIGRLENFLNSASYAFLVHGDKMVSSRLHWCFRGCAEERWALLDAERKLEMRDAEIDEWRRFLKELLPNA
ncbi:uncharacterized protein J3D65DRAFT_602961 [Phyllosticta citribraziliensis]|uniref:Uncharacterized protein n=1 Tax=Phyllosticta citribraziliensis TaxID=989973 RepID=A0ABR1LP03_9PEZI